MRKITVGLLSAMALAGLLVARSQKSPAPDGTHSVHAGETQPANITLERIRALGL